MKKIVISKKYEKLKLENKLYKEELDNIKKSRAFIFINHFPKKNKNWLLYKKERRDNILNIKEELIDTTKGKFSIIINNNIKDVELNKLMSNIMMQRYINYDIILVGRMQDLKRYQKYDERIMILDIEKKDKFQDILNKVYKISNSEIICYINDFVKFNDNFLQENLSSNNIDVKFICLKSNINKFAMFIKKCKLKYFLQNNSFDITKLEKFSNIKIKWK